MARVTVEEMLVTNRLTTPDALPGPFGAADAASFEQHAAYLASHLRVTADGVALSGGVARVTPPEAPQPAGSDKATYELLYPLPPNVRFPRTVQVSSEVLTEPARVPGAKWEASYVVRINERAHGLTEGLLLTSSHPISIQCDGSPPTAKEAGTPHQSSTLFKDYFLHGIHHIFSRTDPGYDHLLFVTALVLGTTKLWELFKLVTAFTLAHTITLTLAALNLVHVSERVVEPLIALSICFVAVENVFWPGRSKGWLRLGVAFFFGLFHGLGFAGALLDAMQGMSGPVVGIAIVAFSLGVETAHQAVVLPLFAALKLLRHARADEAGRARLSLLAQRFGSVAISVAGLLYLLVALRLSFAAGN